MTDHQHLGVTVVVRDYQGRVLLGRRKNSYHQGWWGMPGGRLEVGETLIDAARRELLEETGLSAEKLLYVGVVRDGQDGYDFIHFTFVCESYSGELTLREPEKCEGWEWIAPESVPEQTLRAHVAGLALAERHARDVVDLPKME